MPSTTPIIIDTNVLRNAVNKRKVPNWLRTLAADKQTELSNFKIVILETVALELSKTLEDAIAEDKANIENLAKTLRDRGASVSTDAITYNEDFSIKNELTELGFSVVEEDLTLEDYQEAHRRTCMHEDPKVLTQNNKGQEEVLEQFRDVAIYVAALRLARSGDGAFLVSEDGIFSSKAESVIAETTDAKLMRVKHLSSCFGLDGPREEAISAVMEVFWTEIKRQISGLTDHPHWQKLTINSIVNGLECIEQAWLSVELEARVGRQNTNVAAEAELSLQADGKVKLRLSAISRNGVKINDFELNKQTSMPRIEAGQDQDMEKLKEILGEVNEH